MTQEGFVGHIVRFKLGEIMVKRMSFLLHFKKHFNPVKRSFRGVRAVIEIFSAWNSRRINYRPWSNNDVNKLLYEWIRTSQGQWLLLVTDSEVRTYKMYETITFLNNIDVLGIDRHM